MAKIKFNPLVTGVQGTVGNMVSKTYMGRPYSARRPDFSKRVLSEKQLVHLNKIKSAAGYAKAALAVPETRAAYYAVAKKDSKPLSSVAIGDYMNPPEIKNVDLTGYARKAGDRIVIDATDDFEVMSVEVIIRNNAGTVMEKGVAVKTNNWIYSAKTTLPGKEACALEVAALDRPGNRAVWAGTV